MNPSNKPTKKIRFHKKTHYSQKITQKSNINTIKIQFFFNFSIVFIKINVLLQRNNNPN